MIVDGDDGSVDEAWRDFQVETHAGPRLRGRDRPDRSTRRGSGCRSACCSSPRSSTPGGRCACCTSTCSSCSGSGVSLFFFNRAEITASVALTYPVLGYFLIRMLVAGFWPREREGPLVPLVAGALAGDRRRRARGRADRPQRRRLARDRHRRWPGWSAPTGSPGASRSTRAPSRSGSTSRATSTGRSTTSPTSRSSSLCPWDGVWDDGRRRGARRRDRLRPRLRRRPGRARARGCAPATDGRALGWALAFAWVACPWTLYTMNANANDALIAALGIGALLALRSAPARGVCVALGAAAKFGPAALAPLFATADRRAALAGRAVVLGRLRRRRACVVTVPFIPDGGLREIYDRTLGYQATRSSPFSVWGQAPVARLPAAGGARRSPSRSRSASRSGRASSRRCRSRRWRRR